MHPLTGQNQHVRTPPDFPPQVDAAMVGVEEVEPLRSVMAAAKMGHLAGRPKPLKDVKQVGSAGGSAA